MDPFAAWPFFVDRPNRRTTIDNRYPFSHASHPYVPSPFGFGPADDESPFFGYPSIYQKRPPVARKTVVPNAKRSACKGASSGEMKCEAKLEPTSTDREGTDKLPSRSRASSPAQDKEVEQSVRESETSPEFPPEHQSDEIILRVGSRDKDVVEESNAGEEPETDSMEKSKAREEPEIECEEMIPDEEVQRRLSVIAGIEMDVKKLEEKVDVFTGTRGSKEHLFLEETLISYLLKLDGIQAEGNSDIRSSRKSVVLKIEEYINKIQGTLNSNEHQE